MFYEVVCILNEWLLELKELDSSMTDEALEQGIASMMEENRIMEERIKSLQRCV